MQGSEQTSPARRVVWLFTDRRGGVSQGPYRWLNLSAAVGDEPRHVAENRRWAAARLGPGASPGGVVWVASQVHGREVLRVGSESTGEPGPGGWRVAGRGDALMVTEPGQPVAVLVADCAPVLLADARGRAVAAVHAGWRGLAAGVVSAAVDALTKEAGSDPADLEAWVGPCIRGCCYEVGPEVAEALTRAVGPAPMAQGLPAYLRPGRGDRFWLDVAEATRQALLQSGLKPERLWMDGRCTACHPELFFSHRRDGVPSGRMAGMIALMEG